MDPFIANRGNGPASPGQRIGIGLEMGDGPYAVPCTFCTGMDNKGVWVKVQEKPVILLCLKCMLKGLDKYQDQHPMERLFDVDVDVDDKAKEKAAEVVKKLCPEIPDSKAAEVAQAVIDCL